MCGRYTLRSKPKAIAEEFDLPEVSSLEPRFNIAPNHPVAVVRFDPSEGSRRLDFLTWGLVPSWADDPGIGDRMINARGETVADKPAFRHPFRTRRCLVVNGSGRLGSHPTPGEVENRSTHRHHRHPMT